MAQKPQGRAALPPVEILAPLNGGLNDYNDPTQCKWNQWESAANVFSGAFGFLQRARFANVVTTTGVVSAAITSAILVAGGGVELTVSGVAGFANGQPVQISGVPLIDGVDVNGIFLNPTIGANSINYFIVTTDNTASGTVTPSAATATTNATQGYLPQTSIVTTLKYYALPTLSSYLISDSNGLLFSSDSGNSYFTVPRLNPYFDPNGQGMGFNNISMFGPWSRATLQNILYEMNGSVKQSGRTANAATVENWGIDTPDTSPQVVISSGSVQTITNIQRLNGVVTVTLAAALTVPGGNGIGMVNVLITSSDTSFVGSFVVLTGSGTTTLTWAQLGLNTSLETPTGTVDVNITKSIGRSYAWAWENANKPHVSAPSPSTQFVLYNAQNGAIQLIEQGTISWAGGTNTITGIGTAFSPAWVGRRLWVNGFTISNGNYMQITSVQSTTSLTIAIAGFTGGSFTNAEFQVYDLQSTHIRLYETADGEATYFRTQRNVFDPTQSTLIGSGLQFFDTANAEPPNFPFTTETSQLNNVPPPIGAAVGTYQGALIVFAVPGAEQSFFYNNQTLTTIGLPGESFAPLNQYTIPIANAEISGWCELPGDAVFWSNRQDMFRFTGQLQDNTAAAPTTTLGATVTRLPYNLGCVNPYAVDVTPLGAIWVTPQAEVWLFTDKYAPRNVGRPVQAALNSISQAMLPQVRVRYYHNDTRDWLLVACATNGATENNTLLILDLDLLASNGSPSFFVFDMATNAPVWYQFNTASSAIEVLYEPDGLVRLFTGGVDNMQDVDYTQGFGTEIAVTGANVLTHAWGNDSAPMIKRPSFMRFTTNRDPSQLASDGWSFAALGIDDDYYTFDAPLTLTLTPGVNDTSSLCGNPAQSSGSPFRHSPELFRIGGVNFVMGRRIQFQINFPTTPGLFYQFRQIQLGFAPSPPR